MPHLFSVVIIPKLTQKFLTAFSHNLYNGSAPILTEVYAQEFTLLSHAGFVPL